jgi:hypothetical protein
VVDEASVTLHPARAQMGIGNAGSVYVNMGQFVRSHRLMHTDGLFNCIAVVAHHEESGYAAFTHYNTANAFRMEADGDDDDSENYRLVIDIPSLNQLRAQLLHTLGRNAGVDFYVVFGIVWHDKPTDSADHRRMKQELIAGSQPSASPCQSEYRRN